MANNPTKFKKEVKKVIDTLSADVNGRRVTPKRPGKYLYYKTLTGNLFNQGQRVTVEVGAASGLFCRELRMGGSSMTGFADWDRKGYWRFISK